MKIKTTNKLSLTLESVAMTDIILNMFIFFFISFSLLYTFNPRQESKIKVNLPKGMTNVPIKRGENPLVITVTDKNEIYILNNRVPELTLKNELMKFSQAKDSGVIVKADKQASVDYFVKVLDAAKQAGLNKVSISIELKKKE